MSHTWNTDIVILGGGVSGLWLLNTFKQLGFHSLLLEKTALGSGQTLASQGMIHGGVKYALGRFTNSAAESIASMPGAWRKCLSGTGTIDLREVQTLSDNYYLFSDDSISSRATNFLGSKLIQTRVTAISGDDLPPVFANEQFKGSLYALEDLVIDGPSLVSELKTRAADQIFLSEAQIVTNQQDTIDHLLLADGNKIQAQLYVFAAGAGNKQLLEKIDPAAIKTQTRPLHQAMLSKPGLPALYAHAISLKTLNKPRLTITTHQNMNRDPVWYIGGELAETGVVKSEAEQINFARQELTAVVPWVDLSGATWATHRVDRAEPMQSDGARPDRPFFKTMANALVCWPTKLTLVPMMVEEICASLTIEPGNPTAFQYPDLPAVPVAPTPWEVLGC